MNNKSLQILAGILMISASSVNYFLNDDYISLGIFSFSGIGFVGMGISDYIKKEENRKRTVKLSVLFFILSFLVFLYWLLVGKLEVI